MKDEREKWKEWTERPGKFEGEAPYVPYFWNLFLAGECSEDDGLTVMFKVEKQDREIFPELCRRRYVKLGEDEQGFVYEVRQ